MGYCAPKRDGLLQRPACRPAGTGLMTFDDKRPVSCRTLVDRSTDDTVTPLAGVPECTGWDVLPTADGAVWSTLPKEQRLERGALLRHASTAPTFALGAGDTGSLTLVRRLGVLHPGRAEGSHEARLLRWTPERHSGDRLRVARPRRGLPRGAALRRLGAHGVGVRRGRRRTGVGYRARVTPQSSKDSRSPRSTSTTTSRSTTPSRSGRPTSRSTTTSIKAPMVALTAALEPRVRAGEGVPPLPRRPLRQGQDSLQEPPGRLRRGRPRHRLVRRGVGARRTHRCRLLRGQQRPPGRVPRCRRRRQDGPAVRSSARRSWRRAAGRSAATGSRPHRAATTPTTRESTCSGTGR